MAIFLFPWNVCQATYTLYKMTYMHECYGQLTLPHELGDKPPWDAQEFPLSSSL